MERMEEPRAVFLFIFPGHVATFTRIGSMHGTLLRSLHVHGTRQGHEDKMQTLFGIL